ncbi:MAG: metallophosphoesterase [Desulfovibrionaceae bacterium]
MSQPARLAVLSDIHANYEALSCVLSDIADLDIGDIVCLGDTIGYGPEPERCARIVLDRHIPSCLGNHERGLKNRRARAWFNPQARAALDRTRELLTEPTIDQLCALPEYLALGGVRYVHGCPPHSVSDYLFTMDDDELLHRFDQYPEAVCFAGHTHELGLYSLGGVDPHPRIVRSPLPQGPTTLDPARRHIVNIGSVGQPRDGDNHAKYCVFTPSTHTVEIRFVPYDIATTAAKILQAGLPRAYADRLW